MKNRGSGSKAKGAAFERTVCQQLSLWVTGGARSDCFWRSAMSGGRATVGRARGRDHARQAGDVSAVAPEGNALVSRYYIECKHYRSLRLDRFLLGSGPLALFWKNTVREARHYRREPLLIARQNGSQTLLLSEHDFGVHATNPSTLFLATVRGADGDLVYVFSFDQLMRTVCVLPPHQQSRKQPRRKDNDPQ